MADTITSGATTITPELIDGYRSERTAGNVIHPAADNPANVDVTFRVAGLRTGTLRLLFLTLTDALAAETLHAAADVLELASTDHPGLDMAYVANGAITVELDDETRALWLVEVDFQEVPA
ncbi:MAG: hypothetical protein WED09_11920 [Homoserinimonas sp.]